MTTEREAAPLRVVPKPEESVGQRVKRLQQEAQRLSHDHVNEFVALLNVTCAAAKEISKGGSAYPEGIRDLCRRFADSSEPLSLNIESLNHKRRS